VLKGGASLFDTTSIGAVFIEIYLSGGERDDAREIIEWLEAKNFRLLAFYDQGTWPERKLFYGNALFLNTNLVG
jgi:hypothetical protein